MTRYLDNQHLPKRLLSAILFAFIFSVVGYVIPDVYYRYVDKTAYLEIEQPISVSKKEYHPCEGTELTTKLVAYVDVNVQSLTQLVLTNDEGDSYRVGDIITAETPIMARDQHIVSGVLPLPCELSEGSYYWQGNATFSVRGIEKTISFISETFTVIEKPTEATDSAEVDR